MSAKLELRGCTKCGQIKPVASFGKHACMSDGLRSQCKACNSAATAEYRAANTEKMKARRALQYAANPEKVYAAVVKWRANNPEKRRAAAARLYAANPEKHRARNAIQKAKNPEAVRIHWHNRRARKIEAGGTLSAGLVDRLFTLQRGKCACGCKQPLGDNYHRDHIMPLALGGSNTDNNIQLLRPECNLRKGAKHPSDFMQQRGFLL